MARKTTISTAPHVGGAGDDSGATWPPPPPANPPTATPNSGSSSSSGIVSQPGPDLFWTDLDGRLLQWHDEITMADRDVRSDYLTITLSTPPSMTAWKDIEIQDGTGAVVAAAWTEGDQHQSMLSVPNAVGLSDLTLVFKKAMLFNVHTFVYQIPDIAEKAGHELTLSWTRDG